MNTSLNALVAKCWELIKGIPHTKLYHYNKEANRCLDAHASRGCLSLDLTLFLEPLGEVAMFIYLSWGRQQYFQETLNVVVAYVK